MTDNEYDAGYWEDRYRSGLPTSLPDPSPSLVAEADGLHPGRALDAGCGRGADTLWLASRGWTVTALDVSATAVDQASSSSLFAERIEWVHADLTSWNPNGQFDLVTSHYVHVPGPVVDLVARLASWVAPGGTVLFVGHASHGHHGEGHQSHPVSAQVDIAQVTAALAAGEWDVLVAEPRTHEVRPPDGGDVVTLHDIVIRAQRTSAV